MNFNNRELLVLDRLHSERVVPSHPYDITKVMLESYVNMYSELFSKTNHVVRGSDLKLAYKLAGRTFIKHNLFLGASLVDIKAGMVYIVSNPAFPDHVKIGMTVDIKKRLSSYQTCDPYRRYKIDHYDFVLDRKQTERHLLSKFSCFSEQGEWVSAEVGNMFLKEIKNLK